MAREAASAGPYRLVRTAGAAPEGDFRYWPPLDESPDIPAFAGFDGAKWPDTAAIYGRLHERCLALRQQLGVAESCTGGLVSGLITGFAGSSRYLYGGWVVYSNHAKHQLLGVNPYDIEENGAVSETVVKALLSGIFEQSPCKWAMAVSGVAGPDGGTAAKPVGTVWCGAAARNGHALVRQFRFGGERAAVRNAACEVLALMLLELMQLEEIGIDTGYKL